jgi:hypothetical protein
VFNPEYEIMMMKRGAVEGKTQGLWHIVRIGLFGRGGGGVAARLMDGIHPECRSALGTVPTFPFYNGYNGRCSPNLDYTPRLHVISNVTQLTVFLLRL